MTITPTLDSDAPQKVELNYLLPGVMAMDRDAGTMTLKCGRVWHYETDCYGHPPGSCIRKHTPETRPYCVECNRSYLHEGEEMRRTEKAQAVITEAIEYGLLPGWFANYTTKALHPWQRAGLDSIYAQPDCNAWIHGQGGTGKTTVAYQYAYQRARAGVMPMITTGRDITSPECDRRARRFACGIPLLILDDIQQMNLSAYSVATLHTLFSARHDKQAKTIITSEFTGSHFAKMISQALGGGKGKSTIDRLSWPKRQCISVSFEGERNLRHEK